MSKHPIRGVDLLPILAAAFPHTFFADPRQVQPLKIDIHRDIAAARPAGIMPYQVGRFLWWYVHRPAYLKALARGQGRIDLTGAVVDTDIPAPIRQRAQQEVDRRRPPPAARKATGPAAAAPPSAALWSRLTAAFPRTFFADPPQVQPLKAFLYRDLLRLAQAGTLPDGIDRAHLKPFLRWYRGRTSYLNALARGAGRIDLTGTVVATAIPDAVRQRARAEAARRRQQQAARSASPRQAATPAARPTAPINLEELYAMAVDAKLEVTLKFSTLPQAKPAGAGKMAFALRTPDGQFVTAEVGSKVWAKFTTATAAWPAWMAALSGTMGPRTEKGFALVNPGLQVFERKPKVPIDAGPMTDTPRPPPPATPAPPPPAPVAVATGAGTATVTKRPSLSLKRNALTEGTPG